MTDRTAFEAHFAPAPKLDGARHKIPCACYEGMICPQPDWCNQTGCKVAQGLSKPVFESRKQTPPELTRRHPMDFPGNK